MVSGLGRGIHTGTTAASDAGFVTGGAPHLMHIPKTLEEGRHVADTVASSFSMGREAMHYGNKIKPVASAMEAAGTKMAPALRVASKAAPAAAPASKFIATKAAPALWALDMGLQAKDVYENPEASKNEMMEVANQNALKRTWHAVNKPVSTIAGTAQITGDLIGTSIDNANAPERARQQEISIATQSLNKSNSPLARAATGRSPHMQLTQQ